MQELPPLRLVVSEHQLEQVTCPHCQQSSRGTFPTDVPATTQYGSGVRALAVYLNQYQLVPSERTCVALSDLCGCELSEGTLARWVEQAAETLEETVTRIAEWVSTSRTWPPSRNSSHGWEKQAWFLPKQLLMCSIPLNSIGKNSSERLLSSYGFCQII